MILTSTGADMLQRSGCKPYGTFLPSWASKTVSLEVSQRQIHCTWPQLHPLLSRQPLFEAQPCSILLQSQNFVPKEKQLAAAQQQKSMTLL